MNAHSRSAPGAETIDAADSQNLCKRAGKWYPRTMQKPQKDKGFLVRCTAEELELAHRVAEAEGLTLSAWVRRAILQAARGLP
jgi:hypothetical protein